MTEQSSEAVAEFINLLVAMLRDALPYLEEASDRERDHNANSAFAFDLYRTVKALIDDIDANCAQDQTNAD